MFAVITSPLYMKQREDQRASLIQAYLNKLTSLRQRERKFVWYRQAELTSLAL